MKLRLLISLMALLATGGATLQAQGCGPLPIKPVIPIGCKDLVPMCTCDSQGKCSWSWVCVPGVPPPDRF